MLNETPPSYLSDQRDLLVWQVLEAAVQAIRGRATQALLSGHLDTELLVDGPAAGAAEERLRGEIIPRILAEEARKLPAGVTLPPFAEQVVFSVLRGYGELDPLFLDPDVTEIIIDGPDRQIYVERHGVLQDTGGSVSRDRLSYLIERLNGGRAQPLSTAFPVLEMRLPMARATAVHESLAPGGPALVVRLRARCTLTYEDLIAGNTISASLWAGLAAAFCGGANILIAGESSSGKTTLLTALLASLPIERRIVTVEDPIEIDIPRARLRQLEVRHSTGEHAGGFSQRELVRLCLRLRPDHVIVGEVRDGAAWDMVDSMSLGQRGSLATIHAGSPAQTLLRLENLCLRAEAVPPLAAIQRTIAEVVDLVVQMHRIPIHQGGRVVLRRAVTAIDEVLGHREAGELSGPYRLSPLATLQGDALQPTGTALSPQLTERLLASGIAQPLGMHGPTK